MLCFYLILQVYKREKIDFLIPECISCEIALTPTSGFQFDKSPARRVKGAHEGNAHAEYHQPVASNDPCKNSEGFCKANQHSSPMKFFFGSSHSPKAKFLAVTSEHGW